MSLRLGIDVGGTNTDAVVLDQGGSLQASAKSPTTTDLQSGIASSIAKLVESNPALDVRRITHAMLGTTHCTNAILERRNLNRVGLVRIGAPATLALPPFTAWPADLRAAVGDCAVIVEGGHEFDGREILPLDEQAVREAARSFRGRVDALAVVSVFSSVDFSHEQRAAAILLDELGDLPMTYSREIGALGLLERENAAILNAAVVKVVRTAARGFDAALRDHGIEARLFFSQNDGTLMTLDYATRYPILTVSSGPSNSIRGAAYLSRLKNAIVVDVGGTSTDVGVLVNGFPRESSIAVNIGGVATNFRMPDLLSIALGGGTRVHADGDLRLGPDSVGYRIVDEARVFGGRTLTTSDVAVATGQARMGDPALVGDLEGSLVSAVTGRIREMAEDTVDRMRTSPELLPVIMVGGGSVILPSELAGTGPVHRPDHYDVANAIGAAIAQCSGEIDRVFPLDGTTREALMEQAQDLARQEAVNAGADPATVEIVEVHEVPLAYLPNRATRIRVRASGDLAELSA